MRRVIARTTLREQDLAGCRDPLNLSSIPARAVHTERVKVS